MSFDCLTCNYIKDELDRRMEFCENDCDKEFYKADFGASCWCDKIGGKLNLYGVCDEGGIKYDDDIPCTIGIESHRGISYRRNERAKHIARRKRICNAKMIDHPLIPHKSKKNKTYYTSDFSKDLPGEWYSIDGKYDKGKIHCGCPICKPYKGYYPSWKQEIINKDTKLRRKDWEVEETLSLEDLEGIAR